jgi:2-phospho-L-lactate guanylyltransferase
MRLPADLPCVLPSDIDELLATELARPGALIAPSREGTGTNAIIRTPPDLFPSRFGPDSLRLHKEEAARVGVDCLIVENPRIALDIDEPSDLEMLLERGRGTEAFQELARMNIEERLKRFRIADLGMRIETSALDS